MWTEETAKAKRPNVRVRLVDGLVVDGWISNEDQEQAEVYVYFHKTWLRAGRWPWSCVTIALNNKSKPLSAG